MNDGKKASTKLDAATAALAALDDIREGELPCDFHGGKFTDNSAGWYWSVQFRRTLGNNRSRSEVLQRDIDTAVAARRTEILSWMQSESNHWPPD